MLGQGNISFKGNRPAGPPFVATSAANGVSVDPVSGKIVLGNNVAAILATLLSNREIPMSTFSILFSYPTAGNSLTIQNNAATDFLSILSSSKNRGINMVFTRPATTITGWRIQNTSTNGSVETDLVNDAGRGAFWDVLGTAVAGGDVTRLQITGNELRFVLLTANAIYRWFIGATERMRFNTLGNLIVATGGTDNGAKLRVGGTIIGDFQVVPKNLAPYVIDSTLDGGTTFTNEGAGGLQDITLPTASANTTTGCYVYSFIVQSANGLRVIASAGDTIRIGTSVSAAAGNIQSTNVGSAVRLHCINATEWVAESVVGSWTVT